MEIAEFLLARVSEDETAARATYYERISALEWRPVERPNPRALAEVEAKRRIVERYQRAQAAVEADQRRVDAGGYSDERGTVGGWEASTLRPVLGLLARPYADHPDYDLGWEP